MGLGERAETAADAFGVLASETRLEILWAVWAHRMVEQAPITYSLLKERVGIDDSGKFNYHLDKLRGRFVREEGDGYTLRMQGVRALEAVYDGRFEPVEEDHVPVEGYCPVCGGGMQVGYHFDFYVGCGECWEPHLYRTVEPGVLTDREWRELMLAADRGRRYRTAAMFDDTCPQCGGETDCFWQPIDDPAESEPTTLKEIRCAIYCVSCWAGHAMTAGELLHAHPTVREYCDEQGIDLDAEPFWSYEWVLTDLTTVAHSEDPWRVEKVATVDGRRLAVVFDEDGRVEAVTGVDLRGGSRAREEGQSDRTPGERPADDASAVASDGGRADDGDDPTRY